MCGGGTQTTTTKTEIPPEVLARYNAVNARAEQAATTPFQQYGGEFVAGLNPTQQAGIEATNQYSQTAQPYFGVGTGLTLSGAQAVGPLTQRQIGYYQNPYTQYVAGATEAALRQQQGQQLSQQQAEAIKSGAFGGDRAGIQRAYLQGQQGLATAQALAPIYQQGYQQAVQTAQGQQGVIAQDLARQLQAGQQVAGLGTGAQAAALQGAQAQIQAGTLGQQTQQAQDTALYQQFLQERGYPYQQAQFLANIAEGTGALSGSTQTTQAPAPFFSDKRLKHDAEKVGEMHDGTPIYRFKYNGSNQTQIGLMAQDVEKRHPEAVGQSHGYKTVDYEKATDEAAHKANGGGIVPNWMGGAVVNPGHYAIGGLADTDLSAILAQQRQSFGPFGQGGIYGGSQHTNPYSGGMGGASAGYVPPANLHVAKLMTPSSVPAARQTSTAGELYSNLKSLDSIASDITGKGLFQRAGEKTGLRDAPQAPAQPPAAPKPEDETVPARAYGGLVPHYAAGGPTIPGEEDATDEPGTGTGLGDPLKKVVAEGAASAPKSLPEPGKPAQTQQSGPNPLGLAASGISAAKGLGSIGTGISNLAGGLGAGAEAAGAGAAAAGAAEAGATAAGAAGAAGGIGSALGSIGTGVAQVLPFLAMLSDERVKHNKRLVGKLYDGQPVYSFDYGDGRTQLGLMAQHVEHKHPEAVAETEGGLKMVDYHRATEHAAHKGHFAEGGLVPRSGFEPGGTADETTAPAIIDESAPAATDYPTMVAEAARQKGLAPEHATKLVQGESGFKPRAGDDGSSGSIWQLHVGGLSDQYPHSGLGDTYFAQRQPELASKLSPAEKVAYLNDSRNQKDITDFATDHIAKNGAGAWTQARVQGLFGLKPSAGGLSMKSITEPVSNAIQDTGGFLSRNKDIILPVLQGLGAMAASPSRYLGSAILQGIGAGAKSYADLQKQTADVAQTQASTAGTQAVTASTLGNIAKNAFVYGPNGQLNGVRVYINGRASVIPPTEYFKNPKAYQLAPELSSEAQGLVKGDQGTATGTVQRPSGTDQQPAQQTITGEGGPKAPAAPPAPYRGLSAQDVDLVTKNAANAQTSNPAVLRTDPDANPFAQAQAAAVNSAATREKSLSYAKSLSEIPAKGPVSANEFSAAITTPAVEYINGLIKTAGGDFQISDPKDLANVQNIRKLEGLRAQSQTSVAGQRAYAALEKAMSTVPTQANTPEGAALLFSDILQSEQTPMDYYRHLNMMRDYALKNNLVTGQDQANLIGTGSYQNFMDRYANQQAAEKKALQELFLMPLTYKDANGQPQKTSALSYLVSTNGNPPPALKKMISEKYGPEIFRYFDRSGRG